MLKVLLYGIATFLETGIGICFFEKMFPKRERMERRHYFAEWGFYTLLIIATCSFSNFYLDIEKDRVYIILLIVVCILIFFKVLERRKKFKQKDIKVLGVLWMTGALTAQYWDSYLSILMMITGNLFFCVFLFIYYRSSFFQSYLWSFLYSTGLGIMKILYINFWGVLQEKAFKDYFIYPRKHTYMEVIYWITVGIVIGYLLHTRLSETVIKKLLTEYKMLTFITTLILWRIIFSLVNFGAGSITPRDLSETLMIFIIIILALIFIFVKTYGELIENEKRFLKQQTYIVKEQYKEISISYNNYRRLVHDEKHLISYVAECLENGAVDEAVNFLQASQDELIRKENHYWTGIQSVDFMLNIKYRKMKNKKINFTYNLSVDSIPLEDTDFIVVLGNLLDNSIEAACKCSECDRYVDLCMRNVNQQLVLKLKNSCSKKPLREKKRFITDKIERETHGIGLESVKSIVEQYEGVINFAYDDTKFEVTIIV